MSESKDIASVEGVIWELLAFRSPSTPARNDVVDRAIALLSALEKSEQDALRYRYFRSLWERIEWQHGSVEGYDVVNDDKTVASDCNWGDERIGRALDTAIDLARGQSL